MARTPMYFGKNKEVAEALATAQALNSSPDAATIKRLNDKFHEDVKSSVYEIGEKVLDYFKTNNVILDYRVAYPKITTKARSYHPNGIVTNYMYSINLKTSWLSSKTLVTIEAIAVHERSTPKIILGRDFKRNEADESYQTLIKNIVVIAEKHHASINAHTKDWAEGYSID
jgi:hypothetical protein